MARRTVKYQWCAPGVRVGLSLYEPTEETVPAPIATREELAPAASHLNRFSKFGKFFLSSSDYFNEIREEAMQCAESAISAEEAEEDDPNEFELMKTHREIHTSIQHQLRVGHPSQMHRCTDLAQMLLSRVTIQCK